VHADDADAAVTVAKIARVMINCAKIGTKLADFVDEENDLVGGGLRTNKLVDLYGEWKMGIRYIGCCCSSVCGSVIEDTHCSDWIKEGGFQCRGGFQRGLPQATPLPLLFPPPLPLNSLLLNSLPLSHPPD
jgi:hypothetical protein